MTSTYTGKKKSASILTWSARINLPSLKSVGYLKLLSTGNISCPDLGAAFASLNFTADDDDFGHGFTCWTGYEENSWNSSEPNGGLGKGSKGKGGDSDSGASSRYALTTCWFFSVLTFVVGLV